MAIDKVKNVFDLLYTNINGKTISNAARAKLSSWYIGHTYGEITYHGFLKMLAMAKPKRNEVFYDLGSGTGKGVFLAAMLVNFSKVIGIEILKELYDTSQQILNSCKRLIGQDNVVHQSIKFIHGDFRETDISDADVIFMNATCMKYEIDLPFVHNLEQLKKGTRIITNTGFIRSEKYEINRIGPVAFTWGEEEVFIHEKL